MSLQHIRMCSVILFLGFSVLHAEVPSALKLKALALGERGVVGDLAIGEWKVKVGGRDAQVLSERTPKDLGKEGQKWAFIFLPVWDPEFRRMAIRSVATFMNTLPATDSALVVVATANGLECFTPGFTTRPSLWAKALDRAVEELPARFLGKADTALPLPPSPTAEKEEGIEPIQALLASLSARKMDQRADDVSNQRKTIIDKYSIESLPGYAKTVAATLVSLGELSKALAQEPGEKHLVVFSRNEIDDLANPVWARKVSQMSSGGLRTKAADEVIARRDVLNNKLQTEMMMRDVTLARIAFCDRLTQLGLTLHCVGGAGGYTGAFAEASQATGGFQYRFDDDLPTRLSQLLPQWAMRYELEVELPAGASRPVKVLVETTRKNIRLYAPSAQ